MKYIVKLHIFFSFALELISIVRIETAFGVFPLAWGDLHSQTSSEASNFQPAYNLRIQLRQSFVLRSRIFTTPAILSPGMLILIAGISGQLGAYLANAAFAEGHTVRGVGRNPSKLADSISSKLESFVTTSSIYDNAALDEACRGVDAVICAYGPYPECTLDGQLLLLRAAERAGVRRFHACSWNLDWSALPLGEHESYDAFIAFANHARLSSTIKPLYTFCGVLGKTFFAVPGAGKLEGDSAFWQRLEGGKRKINVIGTGEEKFYVTPEEDAAAFTVALVTSEDAEKGGYYRFASDHFTLRELKECYERVKGKEVEWNVLGLTLPVVEQIVNKMRGEAIAAGEVRERYPQYIGLVYAKYMLNGELDMPELDNDKFPKVNAHRITLEDYVKESPDI